LTFAILVCELGLMVQASALALKLYVLRRGENPQRCQ
jgi:hypothetical protein